MNTTAATPLSILCISSYFKGNRLLEQCKLEGATVYLLTVTSLLGENWARHACADVFAVNNFHDRRELIRAVAYLMRSHRIDRIVALDDFDIEVAAHLREHFRMTDHGHDESTARLFRDKLAMRKKALELGILIPQFAPLFDYDAVRTFLAEIPGPWLIKPRSEASAAGIRKLQRPNDVWRRIEELGDEQSYFLIEQMVPGDLFHVDSLTAGNRVIFAEVNAYWRPLLEVYQGGGIFATRTLPRDLPEVAALRSANEQVLTGFGLGRGASHTEFMKAHADGQFYFIETSARVGGANIAEMVEHATGVNLWAEWGRLEVTRPVGADDVDRYELPPLKQRYGGVVISLARQEWPDTSSFNDPEIVYRLNLKHHIGFALSADNPERIQELLTSYLDRIARDFQAAMPALDSVVE